MKKLMEVTGASASIDEVLSYTLSVAKMNVSEFESPLGERYKESAMGIMREAMPLLVSRLQMDMGKELRPEIDRSTEVVDKQEIGIRKYMMQPMRFLKIALRLLTGPITEQQEQNLCYIPLKEEQKTRK